jgi:hypothetical protein
MSIGEGPSAGASPAPPAAATGASFETRLWRFPLRLRAIANGSSYAKNMQTTKNPLFLFPLLCSKKTLVCVRDFYSKHSKNITS